MSREQKNSKAYFDVLDCNAPSMPYDAEYMELYRSWYSLAYSERLEYNP